MEISPTALKSLAAYASVNILYNFFKFIIANFTEYTLTLRGFKAKISHEEKFKVLLECDKMASRLLIIVSQTLTAARKPTLHPELIEFREYLVMHQIFLGGRRVKKCINEFEDSLVAFDDLVLPVVKSRSYELDKVRTEAIPVISLLKTQKYALEKNIKRAMR